MSLTNLSLLITRPNPAGAELCTLLEQAGAIAIYFPTIEILPPKDLPTFIENVEKLGEQDWIIFISPHAVYESIPAIRRRWPIFPSHVKFAAIGVGTAKALQAAGYQVALTPSQADSEGLLATTPFQTIHQQKIAIIRGEGGRTVLAEELTKRGAILTQLIAYQRGLPSNIEITFNLQQIDAILCHSYESVLNLTRLLVSADQRVLFATPILVPSERIKILAGNLGFQTIWVTNNASHQAFIHLLEQKRKEKWPNKI